MSKKEEIVNGFLDKALSYLESTEVFVKQEVPIYIEELLNYKFFEHVSQGLIYSLAVCLVFGTFLSFILLAFSNEFYGLFGKCVKTKIKVIAFSCLVSYSFMFTLGLVVNFSDFKKAYMVKTAPRVYLVEYLKGGIK